MQAALIAQLLPEYFRRSLAKENANNNSNQLESFLKTMEMAHTPTESILENLAAFFVPYQSPQTMLDFLQSCVAFQNLPLQSIPPARKREVITQAAKLQQQKGTEVGLIRIIEIATGSKVTVATTEEIDEIKNGQLEQVRNTYSDTLIFCRNLTMTYVNTFHIQSHHLHFIIPISFDIAMIEPLHHIIQAYKPAHIAYTMSQETTWIAR